MSKPIILLDMDGVLANFHQGIAEMFKVNFNQLKLELPLKYAIHEWVSNLCNMPITEDAMWNNINFESIVSNWWLRLKMYPWAMELLAELQKRAKVVISTSPGLHHAAYAQKIQWLRDNLDIPATDAMLGSKKWLMARNNHILIDDSEHNIDQFLANGGRTVLFPQLWNKAHAFANHERIVELMLKAVDGHLYEIKNFS